jgi:hypothetical protein
VVVSDAISLIAMAVGLPVVRLRYIIEACVLRVRSLWRERDWKYVERKYTLGN